MLDVDLLAVDRKKYTVTDPLLRLWIRLNNGADEPTDAQEARETQRYASERRGGRPGVPVPPGRPAGSTGGISGIDGALLQGVESRARGLLLGLLATAPLGRAQHPPGGLD